MHPCFDKAGYLKTVLVDANGKRTGILVHRIVAIAFLDNVNNLPEINHKNEIKSDNCVTNLEWCSRFYNMHYGTCLEKAKANHSIWPHSRPVLQYSKDGILINEFPSIAEAARCLNVHVETIGRCVRGERKTGKGYIWKYKQ